LEDFKGILRLVGVTFPAAIAESCDGDRPQDDAKAVSTGAGRVVVVERERLAFICGAAGREGADVWGFAGSAETAFTTDATVVNSAGPAPRTAEIVPGATGYAVAAANAYVAPGPVPALASSAPGPQCPLGGGRLPLDAAFLQRIQSFL
jgi:hypothetical protein